MTKEEAIARAQVLHACAPGEEPSGATKRWMEIVEDPSVPGPVRDVLCWVVEFSGDSGPSCDLAIDDATGAAVRMATYG